MKTWLVGACLGLAALAGLAAQDLHQYWDARCRQCHGDAGDFARRSLQVDARGRLLGTHHRDNLETFLRQHYLADDLVAPVTAMLAAQAVTPPLFKTHCASCHGPASGFARQTLTLRNGLLVGKASGRAVAETLRSHGGLAPADIAVVVDALTRVMAETGTQ